MLTTAEIFKLLAVLAEMVLVPLTPTSIGSRHSQIPLAITQTIGAGRREFGFKGIKTVNQAKITMAPQKSQLFFDLIIPLTEITEQQNQTAGASDPMEPLQGCRQTLLRGKWMVGRALPDRICNHLPQ